MEKSDGPIVKKMNHVDRMLSGLLRIETILANPEKFYDKVDTVGGWVKNFRTGKNSTIIFVALSDGSCQNNLQLVLNNTLPNFEYLLTQNIHACMKIKGKLVKSPAKGQPIEMLVDNAEEHSVEVLGENMDPANYPLGGKFHSVEHLRTILHLRPRTNIIGSMARLRNALTFSTHSYFQQLGFLNVHTPLITTSDCEGAGEMFQVTTIMKDRTDRIPTMDDDEEEVDYKSDFFNKPSYLTVSGQLAVENYSVALNNVYTFGPTFRAENSNTVRHLAEFWMIEPEMCFAGLDELFMLTEGYIKFCISYCLENIKDDIEFFNNLFKRNQKGKNKGNQKKKNNQGKKSNKQKKKKGKPEEKPETKVEEPKVAEVKAEEPKKVESETKKEESKVEDKPKEAKVEQKKSQGKGKGEGKQNQKQDQKKKMKFDDLLVYLQDIVNTPFAKMEYTEAIRVLREAIDSKKKKFIKNVTWGIDLDSEHERYLCEEVVGGPLFLYNYPADIKPFYMRLNDDKKTVQNMDLMLPFIGELVGGSVREERYDVLKDLMETKGIEPAEYSYYLDLRKFGTSPHCGFGLGFERLVMLLSGLENIRDAIPFPRYPGHCEC